MDTIFEFFASAWQAINEFFQNTIGLEQLFAGLYNQYIAPIDPFLKTLLLILAAVIFIMGIFAFIKKMIKLFIVIAIIALIIIFGPQLL